MRTCWNLRKLAIPGLLGACLFGGNWLLLSAGTAPDSDLVSPSASAPQLFAFWETPARAATVNWNAGTSGTWQTAANWSGGALPATTDDAILGESSSAYSVAVSKDFSSTFQLNSLTIQSGATLNYSIGGSFNSWRVTTLYLNGGTFNYQSQDRFPNSSNLSNGSQTRYVQTAGTAHMTNYGSFDSGIYELQGGMMTIDRDFYLALASSNASVNISGEMQLITKSTVGIGARGNGGTGTVTMTGGTWLHSNGTSNNGPKGFAIGSGDDAGGKGSLTLSGGTINILNGYTDSSDAKNAGLMVGSDIYRSNASKTNTGTLSISGTGTLNAKGIAYVGTSSATTGKGTVNLSEGGTLRLESVRANATGTFSLTGGTLVAGTWTGDLTLAGTTLETETWGWASGAAGTASASVYSQTSRFGTTAVTGALTMTSGAIAIDVSGTQKDQISAGSIAISGGSLDVTYSGSEFTPGQLLTFAPFTSAGSASYGFTSVTAANGSGTAPLSARISSAGTIYLTRSADTVWTGLAGTSDWFTAENWSTAAVPTNSSDVYLNSGNSVTANLTSSNALNGKAIHVSTGAMLTVTAGPSTFSQAKQTLISVEGGTLFWNNESRIVAEISSASALSFQQTAGVMRATGLFASINGGTAALSGGIFTQSASNGELIVGLDRSTNFNLSGTALVDASNFVISGRGGASTVSVSGGTLLVRALNQGWCRGMTVGGGDASGTGTLNQTGGTINILSDGNLYVGSNSYTESNRNVTGTLNLSGGELNVAGGIFVGKTGTQSTTQKGTLKLSGDGILRAGTLTAGSTTADLKFTGGTLSVGTFNGNFVNEGTTIAPETWSFVKNSSPTTYQIGTSTFNAADEYLYSQDSSVGSMLINGDYTQNVSAAEVELTLTNTGADSITADNFYVTDGVLTLIFEGSYDGEFHAYDLFDSAGETQLDFASVTLENLLNVPYVFLPSSGKFYLGMAPGGVPEPSAWLLLLFGVLALGCARRKIINNK